MGGRHRDTEVDGTVYGTESHHLIADSVSPIAENDAPAIRMDKVDHMGGSGTWGNVPGSVENRQAQADLIAQKDLTGALELGIGWVQEDNGTEYDNGITDALASLPRKSGSNDIDWSQVKFKEGFDPNAGWK